MKLKLLLMIVPVVILSAFAVPAPEKIVATFYTTYGSITGEASLDFHGPNDYAVEITNHREDVKGQKVKVHILKIEKIVTDSVEYRVAAMLENSRDEKLKYCLVKRIAGSDTLGLFQFSSGATAAYYVHSAAAGNYLNINFNTLTNTTSRFNIARYFSGCDTLVAKIKTKTPGYVLHGELSADERMGTWNRMLEEYYRCVTGRRQYRKGHKETR